MWLASLAAILRWSCGLTRIKAAEETRQNADTPKQELASLTKERDEINKQLEAKLKPYSIIRFVGSLSSVAFARR